MHTNNYHEKCSYDLNPQPTCNTKNHKITSSIITKWTNYSYQLPRQVLFYHRLEIEESWLNCVSWALGPLRYQRKGMKPIPKQLILEHILTHLPIMRGVPVYFILSFQLGSSISFWTICVQKGTTNHPMIKRVGILINF